MNEELSHQDEPLFLGWAAAASGPLSRRDGLVTPSTTTRSPPLSPLSTVHCASITGPSVTSRSERHRLRRRHRLSAAILRADDGALRDENAVLVDRLFDADADILPGQEVALGVGEFGAERHLAGGFVDTGAREEQLALSAYMSPPSKTSSTRAMARGGAFEASGLDCALQRQHFIDRLGEVGVKRDRSAGSAQGSACCLR